MLKLIVNKKNQLLSLGPIGIILVVTSFFSPFAHFDVINESYSPIQLWMQAWRVPWNHFIWTSLILRPYAISCIAMHGVVRLLKPDTPTLFKQSPTLSFLIIANILNLWNVLFYFIYVLNPNQTIAFQISGAGLLFSTLVGRILLKFPMQQNAEITKYFFITWNECSYVFMFCLTIMINASSLDFGFFALPIGWLLFFIIFTTTHHKKLQENKTKTLQN